MRTISATDSDKQKLSWIFDDVHKGWLHVTGTGIQEFLAGCDKFIWDGQQMLPSQFSVVSLLASKPPMHSKVTQGTYIPITFKSLVIVGVDLPACNFIDIGPCEPTGWHYSTAQRLDVVEDEKSQFKVPVGEAIRQVVFYSYGPIDKTWIQGASLVRDGNIICEATDVFQLMALDKLQFGLSVPKGAQVFTLTLADYTVSDTAKTYIDELILQCDSKAMPSDPILEVFNVY